MVSSPRVLVEEAVVTSMRGAEVTMTSVLALAIWRARVRETVRPTVRVMFSWTVVAKPGWEMRTT